VSDKNIVIITTLCRDQNNKEKMDEANYLVDDLDSCFSGFSVHFAPALEQNE